MPARQPIPWLRARAESPAAKPSANGMPGTERSWGWVAAQTTRLARLAARPWGSPSRRKRSAACRSQPTAHTRALLSWAAIPSRSRVTAVPRRSSSCRKISRACRW